jgi:hypothetical protein
VATVLFGFSYRIRDAEGIIVSKEFFASAEDTVTIANVQAFSDAYTALLDTLTEGEIIQATVRVILTLTGLKGAPVADSDVQETLLTSYIQSGTFSKWGDDIPAEIDALIVNGRVDLTNALLVAYAAFLVAAHSGFTPASRYGHPLVALYSGTETFRTLRKQLNAKSRTLA